MASNPGAAAFSQQMMEMLMAQQQQMMMANAADGGGGLAAPMTMMAPMQPGGDGADNRINLGERGKPTPITSLGSALLTARVAGMSYDNQVRSCPMCRAGCRIADEPCDRRRYAGSRRRR